MKKESFQAIKLSQNSESRGTQKEKSMLYNVPNH